MLKNIYSGGTQPFHYVTMTYDQNRNAQNWLTSAYSTYWVPTNYFDGGNIVEIGNYNNYTNDINTCKNRLVKNVDAALDVTWLGNATMDIDVSVVNNMTSAYNGFVRVYVCELESSMNWRDSAGKLYTFPFLDWAVTNQAIQLAGGGSWQTSVTWDGAAHNDGYGHTFSGIEADNVMVIVAVADATPHQAYSDPPTGAPFSAYWIDECVGARPAVVLDNTSPTFIKAGPWKPFSLQGAHGGSLHFLAGGGSPQYAAWRSDTVLAPGRYEVSLWKFASQYSGFLASNAPYRVHHAGGITGWMPVNWKTSGNEWIPLGTYDFDASSTQAVVLLNQANGFVVADAVRFVPVD